MRPVYSYSECRFPHSLGPRKILFSAVCVKGKQKADLYFCVARAKMNVTIRFDISLLIALCLIGGGCASQGILSSNTITVEGQVSARGNEPFSALILETDDRNLYVLVFEAGSGETLQRSGRYRVKGSLFLREWNGRPFAHLQVVAWEEASSP